MKWFKHMANARDDEFMEWLEEEYGFEGVGRWWRILEIIASAMDKNPNDPSATHTWKKWQILLGGKRSILISFLSAIHSRGKMNVVDGENELKIIVPKILDLRDNHTRNLQAANKSLESNLALEAEADKNKNINTTPLPPSKTVDNFSVEEKPVETPPPKSGKGKKDFNINDFDAAAAACCSVLARRMLTPTDAQILRKWLTIYDFEHFVLPLLVDKTNRYSVKNYGKRPNSLEYFETALLEKTAPP